MSEMVERAARAICSAYLEPGTPTTPEASDALFALQPAPWQELYRNMARVTLIAVREPTDCMEICGGAHLSDGLTNGDAREIFQAMIDAALRDVP